MQSIDKTLDILERAVIIIALAGMLILISIQVFTRMAGVVWILWSEEASRYFMIWLAMIGLSAGFRTDSHLGLSFFVDKFKGTAKKTLVLVRAAILLAFCIVVLYYGIQVILVQARFVQWSPSLGVPMHIMYLSIPIGYGLSIVRIVLITICDIKGLRTARQGEEIL